MGTALRQSVLMDIMTIIRMIARLTAITDRIGSLTACSSEPARGFTAMVGATTDAGFMVGATAEDTTVAEDTVAGAITAAVVTGGRGLRAAVEGRLITAE